MKRFVCGIALAVLAALARPAAAQMADALGKPLASSDMEIGTVTVRVVDGSPTKPLVGIDVQLVPAASGEGSTARAARTDAEGRATFSGLKPGARYLARTSAGQAQGEAAGQEPGQEGAQAVESEAFDIPASGGVRLMLSTSPWQAAGPMAGGPGGGGMPDPRQMSGMVRPEPADPAKQLTIRVIQGQMSNNVANQPVHLVGYAADGAIFVLTKNTDAGGRATFDGLVPGRIAYYAMTMLPRQSGERTVGDRVRSMPILMPQQVGMRLLLAGELPQSSASPIEDLGQIVDQDAGAGPGDVIVRVFGQVANVSNVELLQLGPQGTQPRSVTVAAVGPGQAAGIAEARFSNVPADGAAVYVARAQIGEKVFLSAPFQTVPDRGATLSIVVIETMEKPVAFSFHLTSMIDDVYLGFQGQLTLHNWSYAPWDPGKDGLEIPLPKDFVGAQVEDELTDKISPIPGRGLLWRGAVPPGGSRFMVGFSLPISEGNAVFDMALPMGAYNSLLGLRQLPGMRVDAPGAGQSRIVQGNDGRPYTLFNGISIQPMQRMVMSISGLPMAPAWQSYVKWAVGGVVLAILAWGVLGIFAQRRRASASVSSASSSRDDEAGARQRNLKKRREHLLDELVALESKKGDLDDDEYQKRRRKLTRQLEMVYTELEQARSDAGPMA